jgi:hypothetical protein
LAFDGPGNLYVANCGRVGNGTSVTVYAPRKTSVLRMISQGLANPTRLAFGPRVAGQPMADGFTSKEFQAVRAALLACNNADRAYLRSGILRWIDDHGQVLHNLESIRNSRPTLGP